MRRFEQSARDAVSRKPSSLRPPSGSGWGPMVGSDQQRVLWGATRTSPACTLTRSRSMSAATHWLYAPRDPAPAVTAAPGARRPTRDRVDANPRRVADLGCPNPRPRRARLWGCAALTRRGGHSVRPPCRHSAVDIGYLGVHRLTRDSVEVFVHPRGFAFVVEVVDRGVDVVSHRLEIAAEISRRQVIR